jgi:hypothetical protein
MTIAQQAPARRPDNALALPTVSDFSPAIVGDLAVLMNVLAARPGIGDPAVLSSALVDCYPRIVRHRIGNMSGALKSFGLLAKNPVELSDLGREIAALYTGTTISLEPNGVSGAPLDPERARKAAKALSRHLLLECNGLKLLEAIHTLDEAGEPVTKLSMAKALKSASFVGIGNGTTKHVAITNWFKVAGIIFKKDTKTIIDDSVLKEVAGVVLQDLDVLGSLNPAQRMFLGNFWKRARVNNSDYVSSTIIFNECQRTSHAVSAQPSRFAVGSVCG